MKGVHVTLVPDPKENEEEAASEAEGQSEDIEQGEYPVVMGGFSMRF